MSQPSLFQIPDDRALTDPPVDSKRHEAPPPLTTNSASAEARPLNFEPFNYATTPLRDGRTLVEASAGTGKTFALSGLVLRLVLNGDRLAREPGGLPDLRRLLVVTFTVAATAELKTRIRAALRTALAVARGEAEPDPLTEPLGTLLARGDAEARLLAALDVVDEAGIFTIHGFCQRVLKQAAFESGTPFDLELTEETGALEARAAADAWASLTHGRPWLAALAVQRGWTPRDLVEHHLRATTFPDTTILPEAPPLDDALGTLSQRAEALVAAWDADAVTELLDELVWTKKAPFDPERILEAADRVAQCATDPDALEAASWFTLAALKDGLHGTRKVNKDRLPEIKAYKPFAACAAVTAAIETLRVSLIHEFSALAGGKLAEIKERRGVLGFDDLLNRLHDALHAPETRPGLVASIQRLFGVALVDEFQDTDPIQYGIFKTAFAGRPLVFVGDPKQAIYGFRGADIHAYLRAQREADARYTLGTNWRSSRGVVTAINALFENARRPFLYEDIAFHPVEASRDEPRLSGDNLAPVVWWTAGAEGPKAIAKGEARTMCVRATVAEILRLLSGSHSVEGRALQPGDLAVLVRSNRQAGEIQDALREVGVAAVVSRAGDIRETDEIADVEIVLHALARPADNGAVRAALATRLFGQSAHEIAALDDEALAALRARFRDGQTTWRRHGVLRALTELMQDEAAAARLLAYPDGERRMTNLRHVIELLHDVEGAADRSPEDLLHWLRHRDEQTLASRDKAELRLERDDDAVQITTLHNAKGLEYEVVFLPLLWDVLAEEKDWDRNVAYDPLVHTDDGVVYCLDPTRRAHFLRLREVERLAEFLRLAYVALTRAKERAYVAWGAFNQAELSSLAYLLAGREVEGETDADRVEAARKKAKNADPLAVLAALIAGREDVMEARDLTIDFPNAHPETETDPNDTPATRTLPNAARHRARDSWRRASFSGWTRYSSHTPDAASPDADGLAASDETDAETRDEAPPEGLHAFAAGTGPGTCLHEILQHVRWDEPEDEKERKARDAHNRETVQKHLLSHGLIRSGRPHRAPINPQKEIEALVARVAAAPLFTSRESEPRRMADAEHRIAEWTFAFPLGRVAPAAMAEVFREHGTEPFGPSYADALARLSRDAVDGLMVGEIDVVAVVDGRWWVADWKFNRLGSDASAYSPEALQAAMLGHHYGLQLHLYTLGLHRYLRSRLGEAYDYETHIGGATYAFLRGLGTGDIGTGASGTEPSTRFPLPLGEEKGERRSNDSPPLGTEAEGVTGSPSPRPPVPGALFTHRSSAALIAALDCLLAPDA